MKRNLTHENIDIFFLLNENKILTKSELQKVLPKENYSEYIKGFYRRRFIDLFNKNYEYPWFAQKYLMGRREFKVFDFQFKNFYFMVNNVNIEEDPTKLKNVVGYINHYVITPDGLRMNIILELNEMRDISEEMNTIFITSQVTVDVLKAEDLVFKQPSGENANILQMLSNFYKVNTENVDDPLRKMFLFCTTCNIQYDSDIEMAYNCNKNCVLDNRRKELLKNYTDFSFLKDIQIDFIIKSNIIKYEENVYKCAYCDKKFESVEFINLHYAKKHSDEIALREKKYEEYKVFIENIDLRLLYLAEGSLEGKPWFAKTGDDNRVVYDMNHVFSGEIVL